MTTIAVGLRMMMMIMILIILFLNFMYRNYNALCNFFFGLDWQSVLVNANRKLKKNELLRPNQRISVFAFI